VRHVNPQNLVKQLANNNVNASGSFIEQGLQQVNVRAIGLVNTVHDIQETVIKAQNGTALRVKDIAAVIQPQSKTLGTSVMAGPSNPHRRPVLTRGGVRARKDRPTARACNRQAIRRNKNWRFKDRLGSPKTCW
jgi:Cu/Ag efflux pump CusA